MFQRNAGYDILKKIFRNEGERMESSLKNRKGRGIFLLLLVWLFCFSTVTAKESDSVIRIGYYENEVFQEGAREGAVKNGYAYEYYRKLSEYTGWKYEYVYGSFHKLYQMLLDGEIDLMAGLAWQEEREGKIGYPKEAMGNETYNLVKHDTDEDITTEPKSLQGKKIGVLKSALAEELEKYLDDCGVEAEIVTYRDYEALFFAFDSLSIDVLAAEGDGSYGREHAEVIGTFGAADYFLCVSIHRPELLEELNEAQAELKVEEPNYLNSLRIKYYSASVSSQAFSRMEREWMETHDQIRVGYLKNYLPYSDMDAQGNVNGMIKDILPGILDSMEISSIKVHYQGFESYEAMIEAVSAGEIDLAFPVGGGLYYSEENGIYQSNPVASASTELVYKGNYNDRKVSHIAVNEKNQMQYYYVKTNFPAARITRYPSIEACLEAVLSGEAGSTTLNGLRANDMLKNSKYKGLYLMQLSQNDDRCFGVKIGNEGLLKLMNRGINVVEPEYLQNAAYSYTGELYSHTLGDYIKENMVVFGSLMLLIAGIVIVFFVRASKRFKREVQNKEAEQFELEEKVQMIKENSHLESCFNEEQEDRTKLHSAKTVNIEKGIEYYGDKEDYLEMVEIFSRSLPEKAEELETAIEKEDTVTFSVLLHLLKSTLLAIGAESLSEEAKTLEEEAKRKKWSSFELEARKFLENYKELEGELREILQGEEE